MWRSVAALLLLCCTAAAASFDPLQWVDPFIGSGGAGFGYGSVPPGAQMPWSQVRASPDTAPGGLAPYFEFEHFSGYNPSDTVIRCFSHVHMQGSGALALGLVGVMPFAGTPSDNDNGYWFAQSFAHENERAAPAYYSVLLPDADVLVEITASLWGAVHRYTFRNASAARGVVFPAWHGLNDGSVSNATVTIDGAAQTVVGSVLQNKEFPGRFGGLAVHFAAHFDAPFSSSGRQGSTDKQLGWVSGFESNVVEMRLGISYVSADAAAQNAPRKSFDAQRSAGEEAWRATLGVVQATGDLPHEEYVKFYTALYHASCGPSTYSEESGAYKGFDKKVHSLPAGHAFYSDMSIWDIWRSQQPLTLLLQPRRAADVIDSLLLMFEQGGDMPRWPLAYGYTSSMTGQHANAMIADAYAKGLSFNVSLAYAGMRQGATQEQQYASRRHLKEYVELGYVPYDLDSKGASRTLDYAFDDWAVALMARALGKKEDEAMFLKRSANWRSVFHSEKKFFCPKDSKGEWHCPLLFSDVWDKRYTEGDAWHYRFYVPHDVPSLIEAYGRDEFVKAFEEFFTFSRIQKEKTTPNPFYWSGNEPSLAAGVGAAAFANRTDLVQRFSRMVMAEDYTTETNGLPGNDDYGTLSAWYVWGGLGLFPVIGTTQYALGSPVFENTVISLENGNNIVIVTHNASPQNVYSSRIEVNGKPWTSAFIDHAVLLQGAHIEMWMESSPALS